MTDVIVLNTKNRVVLEPYLTAERFFGSYIQFSDGSVYKITKVESAMLGYELSFSTFVFSYNRNTGELFQTK